MTAAIEIDGKKLVPIKEVPTTISYSRDYITRLAREGKIFASLVGRQWFIDCESLENYFTQAQAEAELRKNQLSEKRKQEQIFYKEKERQSATRVASSAHVHQKAVLMAGFVLCLGLTFGVLGQLVISSQLAAVSAGDNGSSSLLSTPTNQTAETNVVLLQEDLQSPQPLEFSSKTVRDLEAKQSGILLIPSNSEFAVAEVFSDEVEIRTASSGLQSAVLISQGAEQVEKEVPFVLVPIRSEQN